MGIVVKDRYGYYWVLPRQLNQLFDGGGPCPEQHQRNGAATRATIPRAFVPTIYRRTMGKCELTVLSLCQDAPMRNCRVSPRATAIPVGAEQHLGKGNNTAFLTRHCSRHGTLAFLPFEFQFEARRLVQYGQASAPRG